LKSSAQQVANPFWGIGIKSNAVKEFTDNVVGREESRIKFPHERRTPCDEKSLARKRERRKIAAFGNANADKARRIGVR
jgi:hypothetical protein